MILPELPEALIVRRNAHGFTHSFTVLQMDKYGRDCAQAAREQALLDAMNATLAFGKTGAVIAAAIGALK